MKAVTDPVSFLVLAFMGIIFLLLGLALFYGILKAAPEQLAFASTQRLASAIQEACITEKPVEIEFSMQQSKPFVKNFIGVPLRVFAKTKIREFGDPDFVLYYEMFPPGEGIAWEVYHDFEPRGIVTIPDGYAGKTPKDLQELLEDSENKIIEKDGYIDNAPVVISNILLTPDIDASTGRIIPESERTGSKVYFGFGEWVTPPLKGNENIFRFINYKDLTRIEKANIKYMACGINSLCLKTPEGVFTFPLDECDGQIETVQFAFNKGGFRGVIDAVDETTTADVPELGQFVGELVALKNLVLKRNIGAAAIGTAKDLKNLATFTWGKIKTRNKVSLAIAAVTVVGGGTLNNYIEDAYLYRKGDLGFASPCEIRGKVELTQCKANYKVDTIYYYNSESGTLQTFTDEEGNVEKHYTSLSAVKHNVDNPKDLACIRIEIDEDKQGHCYTYNLDTATMKVKILNGVAGALDTVEYVFDLGSKLPAIGSIFEGGSQAIDTLVDNYQIEPVRASTEYFDGIYLMKRTEILSVIEESFNNILSADIPGPVAGGLTPLDTPDEWWWP